MSQDNSARDKSQDDPVWDISHDDPPSALRMSFDYSARNKSRNDSGEDATESGRGLSPPKGAAFRLCSEWNGRPTSKMT